MWIPLLSDSRLWRRLQRHIGGMAAAKHLPWLWPVVCKNSGGPGQDRAANGRRQKEAVGCAPRISLTFVFDCSSTYFKNYMPTQGKRKLAVDQVVLNVSAPISEVDPQFLSVTIDAGDTEHLYILCASAEDVGVGRPCAIAVEQRISAICGSVSFKPSTGFHTS